MNGIVTVFDDELAALRDYSLVDDIIKHAGAKFYRGRLNKQNIIFTKIANNPLEAALAAQLLADRYDVTRLFFSGIALPLAPFINDGDLIIANYFIEISTPDRTVMFEADEKMLSTIRTVSTVPHRGRNPHIFGALSKTISDPNGQTRAKTFQREYGIIAANETGAAFAFACRRNNIPFAVIDVAVRSDDSEEKNLNEKYHSSILDLFEIKGLTLVELTLTALTSDL